MYNKYAYSINKRCWQYVQGNVGYVNTYKPAKLYCILCLKNRKFCQKIFAKAAIKLQKCQRLLIDDL